MACSVLPKKCTMWFEIELYGYLVELVVIRSWYMYEVLCWCQKSHQTHTFNGIMHETKCGSLDFLTVSMKYIDNSMLAHRLYISSLVNCVKFTELSKHLLVQWYIYFGLAKKLPPDIMLSEVPGCTHLLTSLTFALQLTLMYHLHACSRSMLYLFFLTKCTKAHGKTHTSMDEETKNENMNRSEWDDDEMAE